MGPKVLYSVVCSATGVLLLFAGITFYSACRSTPPVFLYFFSVVHVHTVHGCLDNVYLGSVPSFVHAAGMSLITCAILRPTRSAAVIACAQWTWINLLWELLDKQSIARLGNLFFILSPGVSHAPLRATFDINDVAAAVMGSAFAFAITMCLQGRLHLGCMTIREERV